MLKYILLLILLSYIKSIKITLMADTFKLHRESDHALLSSMISIICYKYNDNYSHVDDYEECVRNINNDYKLIKNDDEYDAFLGSYFMNHLYPKCLSLSSLCRTLHSDILKENYYKQLTGYHYTKNIVDKFTEHVFKVLDKLKTEAAAADVVVVEVAESKNVDDGSKISKNILERLRSLSQSR